MRYVQNKKAAFWFYSFLSRFYDNYVNPFFWTEEMRSQALSLLNPPNADEARIVDVGCGTGFTTGGVVEKLPAARVFGMDQSPHQMSKAIKKPQLKNVAFTRGDAENLPFPDNTFDCYVSAGSIEYWPDPARGIRESLRVVKPGGTALMIGPLEPRQKLARFVARVWMLFPAEDEYEQWFREAGFESIEKKYVAPPWIRHEKYGIALSGRKPASTTVPKAPAEMPSKLGVSGWLRFFIGSLFGGLFIPAAVVYSVWARFTRPELRGVKLFNRKQIVFLSALIILLISAGLWLLR